MATMYINVTQFLVTSPRVSLAPSTLICNGWCQIISSDVYLSLKVWSNKVEYITHLNSLKIYILRSKCIMDKYVFSAGICDLYSYPLVSLLFSLSTKNSYFFCSYLFNSIIVNPKKCTTSKERMMVGTSVMFPDQYVPGA